MTLLSGEIHRGDAGHARHVRPADPPAGPPPAFGPSAGATRLMPGCWAQLARLGEAPLPRHPIRLRPLPGRTGIYTAERNYLVLERHGRQWSARWQPERTAGRRRLPPPPPPGALDDPPRDRGGAAGAIRATHEPAACARFPPWSMAADREGRGWHSGSRSCWARARGAFLLEGDADPPGVGAQGPVLRCLADQPHDRRPEHRNPPRRRRQPVVRPRGLGERRPGRNLDPFQRRG